MPVQCPECARFLSNAFVSSLRKGPAPCPKCETELRAEQFSEEHGGTADAGDVDTDAELVPTTDPAPAAGADARASVRPPDLAAEAVRDTPDDPLVGWDLPSTQAALVPDRHDHDPTVTGAAIGAGAAVGLVVGALAADRRVRGALLGGALGAAAGAAAAQTLARRREVDLLE